MDIGGRNIRPSVQQKEISSKKNYSISAWKSVEATINDKKKKYFDKVQSLVSAWDLLAVHVSKVLSESPIREFWFLFSHTLRFVLEPDWPTSSAATHTHLTVILQRFINILSSSKKCLYLLQQCRHLESIVKCPWSHPTLSKIFANEEVDIDELLQFFKFENGRVIVIRLEMMLQSKCVDLAQRLSKSCLLTYFNSHPLELDFNQNELDYITDIYYCSLFRAKMKKELTNEIKLYDLDDGLQLVKRYRMYGGVGGLFNENCKNARLWKYSGEVIELVASILTVNAVMREYLIDSDTILPDLIAEWAAIQKPEEYGDFLENVYKLVMSASSSKCIYPFCSFLIENCTCKERYLNVVMKCLIRAINQNMNEIESYRARHDYANLKTTHEQLSQGFVLISKLFKDQKNIHRECLLTSFSLTPSRARLEELEAFVNKSLSEESPPLAALVPNDQNALDGAQNVDVPICTETTLADNCDIPPSPKDDQLDASRNLNDVDNHDTSLSPNDVDNRDTESDAKRVDIHETVPSPNVVDVVDNLDTFGDSKPDVLPILDVDENTKMSDDWKLVISPDPLPSPNGVDMSDTSDHEAPSPESAESAQKSTKHEAGETVGNVEQGKPESASQRDEPTTAVEVLPPNEEVVDQPPPQISSIKKGLLSLMTDTKLKMDGAVEGLVSKSEVGYCVEVDNLLLEESMKMDLSSILRYQRFRSLSWELEWNELKKNCENFLEYFEARGFKDVELKYLDIDYSKFKDQPINEDDYIGIEKGYEHFAEPEPIPYAESDYGHLSSDDTDDDYSLKRRKKVVRRNKLKKFKPKFKAYRDVVEEFSGEGNKYFIKKKRELSTDRVDGDFRRKKRIKRSKIFSEADVAIDSQSENYPPDYNMNSYGANEAVDESQSANNVQMLRQFRIGMKTSSGGGELSEIACNDANLNNNNNNNVNQMKPIKIVINKCDNDVEADGEKVIKSRTSAAVPVLGKRSTIQPKTTRLRRSDSMDSLDEFSGYLRVSIRRCDSAGEYPDLVSTPLDDELRSMMEMLDSSALESAEAAVKTESTPVEEGSSSSEAFKTESAPVEEGSSSSEAFKTESTPVEEGSSSSKALKPEESVEEAPAKVETISYLKMKPIVISIPKLALEKVKVKRPRGRPRKNSNYSGTSSPSSAPGSLDVPSPGVTDLQPMISQDANVIPATNQPDSLASNIPSSTCTFAASDQSYAPTSYPDAAQTTSSATASTYPQTLAVNSGQMSYSVYVPSNVSSFDGYVKTEMKSPTSTDSSLPASDWTESEVAAQSNFPLCSNSDTSLPSNSNRTEPLTTSANAQQFVPQFYTNGGSSSSTSVVSPPVTFQDVACSMLQQPPHQNSVEPAQTFLGTCDDLVLSFPDISYDNAGVQGEILALPFLPQPVDVTASKTGQKRPRKRKIEDETTAQMANGQPLKVKRQRKPKRDTTNFDYQTFTDPEQSSSDDRTVKIKRPRQPKKIKIVQLESSASSTPVTSEATSSNSSSLAPALPPSTSTENSSADHELATILAVSDVNYEPSFVLPDPCEPTMDEQKTKIRKQRKRSNVAQLTVTPDEEMEDIKSPFSVFISAAVNSNAQPSSAQSCLQPSIVSDSSTATQFGSSTLADIYTSSLVGQPTDGVVVKIKRSKKPKNNESLSGDPSSVVKKTVKLGRPRKQKPSETSLLEPTFSTPAADMGNPLWNNELQSSFSAVDSTSGSFMNYQSVFINSLAAKPKVKRPAKPKTGDSEGPPRKRGRPRKERPETPSFDRQPIVPLTSFLNTNWNQPLVPTSSSSREVAVVAEANYQSSSVGECSSLILRDALTAQPSVKIRRPRKPKNLPPLDSAFPTPVVVDVNERTMTNEELDGRRPIKVEAANDSTAVNQTVIEVDHHCFSISSVENHHQLSTNEIDHRPQAIEMSSFRGQQPRKPIGRVTFDDQRVGGAALENASVVKPPSAPENEDGRYPVVLIPELKIPSSKSPLANPTTTTTTTTNSVRKPGRTSKKDGEGASKRESDGLNSKTYSNGRNQFKLPSVEVRVPSIPRSHFQNFEMRKENGDLRLPATSYNHCTPQSSSTPTISPAARTALNGVKKPRKLSDELVPEQVVVSLKSLPPKETPSSASQVKSVRTPKFPVPPPKPYLQSYLAPGCSSYDHASGATFINASTPKTLAEGYSVIAVPDLESLRTTPPLVQVFDEDRSQQLTGEEERRSEADDHHGSDSANGYNGVSPHYSHQYPNDNRSFGSSLHYSAVPTNEPTVGIRTANIKVEYEEDDADNATPSVCISIPEDSSFSQSYLSMRNYLSTIRNTNNPEQTVSSNNQYAVLIGQLFPDQMPTYSSL